MQTKNEYTKLPKAFKARWVKNLRSGKYKKGKNYLHTDKGFCCLGVAYDCSPWVPKKERWTVAAMGSTVGKVYSPNFSHDMGDDEGVLSIFHSVPVPIKDVLTQDIRRVLPKYDRMAETVEEFLMDANDKRKWSFNRIADWIEKHL